MELLPSKEKQVLVAQWLPYETLYIIYTHTHTHSVHAWIGAQCMTHPFQSKLNHNLTDTHIHVQGTHMWCWVAGTHFVIWWIVHHWTNVLHQTVHVSVWIKYGCFSFIIYSSAHSTLEQSNRNLTAAYILTSILVKSLIVLLISLNYNREREICPRSCFGCSYFCMECFRSPQNSRFWHASLLI